MQLNIEDLKYLQGSRIGGETLSDILQRKFPQAPFCVVKGYGPDGSGHIEGVFLSPESAQRQIEQLNSRATQYPVSPKFDYYIMCGTTNDLYTHRLLDPRTNVPLSDLELVAIQDKISRGILLEEFVREQL